MANLMIERFDENKYINCVVTILHPEIQPYIIKKHTNYYYNLLESVLPFFATNGLYSHLLFVDDGGGIISVPPSMGDEVFGPN